MTVADVQQWVGVGAMGLWLIATTVVVRTAWSAGRRPPLGILIGSGVGAGLFAAYGGIVDAVVDPGPPAGLDVPVLHWMVGHRSAPANAVMIQISDLGGTLGMTVLTALGAAVLLWRRRIPDAVVVLVAGAGTGVLVSGFKNLNARPRPPVATQLVTEQTFALPSGHALTSTVVVGILAVVAAGMIRSTAARLGVGAVAAAVILAIGVSRLYLGVHWLTDVLAGWLLGGAWLALCLTALTAVRTRRAARVPEQAAPAEPGALS
ncbi:phosphatase PAP2 family protein [Pseudonocardia sp.]|jgi:membrane-associated phospholipid phosphatase|uniref:phosphatase PAP2 family protein n=1 Tax=Pseudonocardia sp. TaxID=60912 RepID=UPI0031FDF0E1